MLGTAALKGRYTSSKAKYQWETDSEQVLRRKDEKFFEKRVKRLETVEKEAIGADFRWGTRVQLCMDVNGEYFTGSSNA